MVGWQGIPRLPPADLDDAGWCKQSIRQERACGIHAERRLARLSGELGAGSAELPRRRCCSVCQAECLARHRALQALSGRSSTRWKIGKCSWWWAQEILRSATAQCVKVIGVGRAGRQAEADVVAGRTRAKAVRDTQSATSAVLLRREQCKGTGGGRGQAGEQLGC